MEVITNNVPRDIVNAWELSEKERREFDYIDWSNLENMAEMPTTFFRYKGEVYDLGEFTTTSGLDGKLDLWEGYKSDTFFSGIVVKYHDEDSLLVGRYCF